jgi:hypothetical protein
VKISELINQLHEIWNREGNIEVTCTGSTLLDGEGPMPDVFETTVENLEVGTHKNIGKRVRIWK